MASPPSRGTLQRLPANANTMLVLFTVGCLASSLPSPGFAEATAENNTASAMILDIGTPCVTLHPFHVRRQPAVAQLSYSVWQPALLPGLTRHRRSSSKHSTPISAPPL